jgi:hypothetical protein
MVICNQRSYVTIISSEETQKSPTRGRYRNWLLERERDEHVILAEKITAPADPNHEKQDRPKHRRKTLHYPLIFQKIKHETPSLQKITGITRIKHLWRESLFHIRYHIVTQQKSPP